MMEQGEYRQIYSTGCQGQGGIRGVDGRLTWIVRYLLPRGFANLISRSRSWRSCTKKSPKLFPIWASTAVDHLKATRVLHVRPSGIPTRLYWDVFMNNGVPLRIYDI